MNPARQRHGATSQAVLLGCLVLALVGLSPLPPAEAQPKPVPFSAELVARSFFDALMRGDAARALPLCAQTVNFDGQVARGQHLVEKKLRQMVRRVQRYKIQLKELQLLHAQAATKRFGAPPKRVASSIKPCDVVALARFQRLGAAAILTLEDGFWKVRAITD